MDAICFDFDGTILDTEGPEFEAWRAAYADYGCELPTSLWARRVGTDATHFDPMAYLEACLNRSLPRDEVHARRRQRLQELIAPLAPRAGIVAYLEEARRRRLRLGVASSSPSVWVTSHLARLGLLHYFDRIICRDQVERAKPHPDAYLAVCHHLEVSPQRAIAIEDSPSGAIAAKRAGLFCVVTPNAITRSFRFADVDLRIDSLEDLPLGDLLARANHHGR